MNRLDNKERANILKMLCEGMGINAACRVSGASKNTVLKLLAEVGAASTVYLDENIKGLQSKRVECDEVWSFCYAKQKAVATARGAPKGADDVWDMDSNRCRYQADYFSFGGWSWVIPPLLIAAKSRN